MRKAVAAVLFLPPKYAPLKISDEAALPVDPKYAQEVKQAIELK